MLNRPSASFAWNRSIVGAIACVLLGLGGCGDGGDSGNATTTTADATADASGKAGNPRPLPTMVGATDSTIIAPVASEEPPLELVPPVLDFGVVPPNTQVKGQVQLFNRGDSPMLILAAEPSCKCTALDDIAGSTIAPGESIELGAVLDAAPNIGPKTASIKILVDGYPVVKLLNLEAMVSLPVRPIPSLINAVRGQNRKGRVIVEAIDDQPFSICSVHGQDPTYLGFDPSVDQPRSKYVLQYDLDTIPEPFPRYLVIETDREDVPVVDVYLRHESTLPQVNRRMMLSGGYRFPVGRIEKGGTADIEIPFKDPASPLSGVVCLLPGVEADLIGTRREETPADGILTYALLRITPGPDFQGVLYAPLEMVSAAGDIAAFDVFGVVVPEGEVCSSGGGG